MDALAVLDKGLFTSVATVSFSPVGTPGHLNLGPLQLFGIDTVRPGGVFELHRHENVEVITFVLDGAMEHDDGTGTADRTDAGSVQVMRAGTGLEHSEVNVSPDKPLVAVQMWLAPRNEGNEPSVSRHHFERGPTWTLMVAGEGAPLRVDQDVQFSQVQLAAGGTADWEGQPRTSRLHRGRGRQYRNRGRSGATLRARHRARPRLRASGLRRRGTCPPVGPAPQGTVVLSSSSARAPARRHRRRGDSAP